jgi:hypothetical protein
MSPIFLEYSDQIVTIPVTNGPIVYECSRKLRIMRLVKLSEFYGRHIWQKKGEYFLTNKGW